ncbi:hypothetical protein [Candidatus Paracaedibacter symbiosus]|uniref:hypothetical protein n=1 Tax=Candidatus Paracaedibacter symbiosus TaxID=244582 RepID=UPI000509524B|nr:hypothetical protein [Candidatus Paracaedibacter symbiosus]
MRKWIILAFLAIASAPAAAQTIKAQGPRGKTVQPTYRPAQPFNSTARDTTPFNCEQYRRHPHPAMVGFCEDMERHTLQHEARMQGRPGASSSVVDLPPLGSPDAKQRGMACIAGQAFRRIDNGWEQIHARDGGWQRCRGG